MPKAKKKETDIKKIKQDVNNKHIEFYNQTFEILKFILDKYSKELAVTDFDFLEMPKNSIATLDFLISSIGKVQKGQRLALGLDNEELIDNSPQINLIDGINESRI